MRDKDRALFVGNVIEGRAEAHLIEVVTGLHGEAFQPATALTVESAKTWLHAGRLQRMQSQGVQNVDSRDESHK